LGIIGSMDAYLWNYENNPIIFGTNNTEKMRLDSSGRLGIGTTSPQSPLQVRATARPQLSVSYDGITGLYLEDSSNSLGKSWKLATSSAVNSQLEFYQSTATSGVPVWSASAAMTLDASGNLMVGTTTNTYNSKFVASLDSYDTYCSTVQLVSATNAQYGLRIQFSGQDPNNTTSEFIAAFGTTTKRFVVYANGNVQNTNNSYGAISDVKLKENIVDATPKLADLMQVKVRNYNLKTEPEHKQLGVIAQELETVFPAMVDESPDKDAEGNDLGTTTKSVKYSVFVPMLIKAMQEQQALITQLTARITALETP